MAKSCYFCGCAWKFMCELAIHMRSKHTQERPEKCAECSKTFPSPKHLRLHKIGCHSKSEKVKCPQCPKSFKNKNCLQQSHTRSVHGVKKYGCNQCNYKTHGSERLQRHSRIHEKNRPRKFACEICKKGFYAQNNLIGHLKIHSDDKKRWACYFCPKVYRTTSTGALYTHLRDFHTNEKLVGVAETKCKQCKRVFAKEKELHKHNCFEHRIKCSICEVKLQNKIATLKQHMATHSSLRPFQCSACLASFKTYGNLTRHVRIVHFGLRDYACDECPKRFTSLATLKIHKQNKHSPIQPFPCGICSNRYGSKRSLEAHLKYKHEPKGYQCYFCFREFATFLLLHGHLFTHTNERWFKCHLNIREKPCGFASYKKQQLNEHIRITHEGYRVQCSLCRYKTTQNALLFGHITRIHTRERTIKCVKCGRGFYTLTELRKHECRPIDNLFKVDPATTEIFPCLMCRSTRVTFRKEEGLRVHMEEYHPVKSFPCYFCSKLYNNKGMFDGHIRTEHTMEKVKSCNTCCLQFFTETSLRRHRQTDQHKVAKKK